MSTTKKIKWRLGNLPTPDEVRELVKDGILNKDEAREILFSHETVEERDKKSLEDEIKFLRELISKLSNNSRVEIVKQIEYIEKPYRKYDWYEPYKFYCQTGGLNSGLQSKLPNSIANAMYLTTAATNNGTTVTYTAANHDSGPEFTAIKTF